MGIFQLTNQNSDQSKFKLALTNEKLNSLSMWRVYSLHHTSVFTYSHANTPLGQSERTYYLSYFIKWHGTPFLAVNLGLEKDASFNNWANLDQKQRRSIKWRNGVLTSNQGSHPSSNFKQVEISSDYMLDGSWCDSVRRILIY